MSKANDNPADPFKKALAEATKVMADDPELSVSYTVDPSGLSGDNMRLPQVSRRMTRDEVFRATGPTASTSIDVKVGAKKNGEITAAELELRYQGGAFPGIWGMLGCMTGFACYDIANQRSVGWDVIVNRPKVAAYRAPSAPC